MTSRKLHPGDTFPNITAKTLEGTELTLGKPLNGKDWQLVVVYRGKHCPLCTRYLNMIEAELDALNDIGVDVMAVSGDSEEQLRTHVTRRRRTCRSHLSPRVRIDCRANANPRTCTSLILAQSRKLTTLSRSQACLL